MNHTIFDRSAKLLQRQRVLSRNGGRLPEDVNYIRDHVARNIAERIQV